MLMYSKDRDKYITWSNIVLQTIEEHQLYGNPKMCESWLKQVVFLGHPVSEEWMKVHLKGENDFKVIKANRFDWDSKVRELNGLLSMGYKIIIQYSFLPNQCVDKG